MRGLREKGKGWLGDLFAGRCDVSAPSRGLCKWRRKWPGGLSRSSQPSSLPEADFGSGSASESSDPGTGHTNFHCNVYLETRESKGLRFALARGTPCAPGFLFGLAGACPSGLRAFPAVGFAYPGGCVEAVRLGSEAQPGGLGLGHRSSNFSLGSLRK